MPSIRDIFTFYLKAEHLQGRTAVVAIAACAVEEVFNPRIRRNEPRLILRFHGKKLALACNKTQAAALEQITGTDDYTQWAGCTVALSPSHAHNGKDTIAISAPPVASEKPAQRPDSAPIGDAEDETSGADRDEGLIDHSDT